MHKIVNGYFTLIPDAGDYLSRHYGAVGVGVR